MSLSRRSLASTMMVGALACQAHAGVIFEPITPNVVGAPGTQVNVPYQVRLTDGQSSVEFSYAAFNFSTTDALVAQVVGWSWDPALGGSNGPVTYSHFWSPALVSNTPNLLFGTLTLQLGNVSSGQATINPTQDSGPQWLWQGVDCPANPELGALSVTVPTPSTAASLGLLGLVAGRRRR